MSTTEQSPDQSPGKERKGDAGDMVGGGDLGLSDKEKEEAENRGLPNALIVHEAIRAEGEQELRRPAAGLAFSGLAAGLSMGFSMLSEAVLRDALPDAPWRPLVTKLGYTVGFLVVVLGRQQLFTENTLTPVLPLLKKPTLLTLGRVMRLWAIVLVCNLVGAYLFAWAAAHSGAFPPHLRRAFHEIGTESLKGGFGQHLVRGVFAGWIIALMVWLLPSADQARLGVIVILTYLVGVAQLAHIIAGSVETLYLVTTGAASWSSYFTEFMLPALLGNIAGGVILVAALNFGQVFPDKN